jgi:hypothetical protein
MKPPHDWRKSPGPLIAIVAVFSRVGTIYGDEFFSWLYGLPGIER